MPSSRQQSATVMIPSFCFRASFSNCSLSISFNLRPSRQLGSCSRFIALPILVLSTIISPSHIIFTPTQSYEIVHWFLFFCGEVLLTTTSYPIADSIFTKVSTLMLFPVRRLLTADCVLYPVASASWVWFHPSVFVASFTMSFSFTKAPLFISITLYRVLASSYFLYFTLSSQLPDATSPAFLLRSRSQMSALPISARVSSPPGRSSPLSKNYANDTPTHIKQRAGTRSFLLF